jgi:hypothetical protein
MEMGRLTICTGLSISLCAFHSALTYISPSTRSSAGNLFLCVLNNLLYSGMGGRRAIGAGRKGLEEPASVAVAKRRDVRFIMVKIEVVQTKRIRNIKFGGFDMVEKT